ncbi:MULTISPECIES: antitermination protein [Enterobacterales]|uniref:antitermination protein Q n=1 Tax=Enterobacterales TaxID=91347 RepID=UPI002ED97EF6
MRLKYAITIGDPKSAQIVAYQARSTGNSHLTREDIVISLGITQSRCRTGLSLIYAKYTKDPYAAATALSGLVQYASDNYKKFLPAGTSGNVQEALSALASLAIEEFCRTADTPGAKCRCGGRGQVCDLKKTKQKNRLILKDCPRCKGSGLKPMTETRCHHALFKILGISQSTYSRYWSPLYQALMTWCYRQEAEAEDSYNSLTSLRPRIAEAPGYTRKEAGKQDHS